MKILLVVPEFPPNYIGWGWVVFENLAKNYQRLWHEVLVISGDYTKKNIFQKIKIIEEKGMKIVRIPEIFTPVSMLNTVMPYPFWYNFSLLKIIKNFSPDFVHLHWYGLFMPAQIAKILKKLKINYTFTIHWAPVSPEKMWSKIISLAYNFYHKFYGFPMLENAKNLTAVSSFARDFDIFKNYKEKIQVIWNGINPEDYQKVDYNIYEKYFKKRENTKIILSVWRIEWIKWFDKIIDLLPKIIEKWYDVKYVILWRDNGEKEKLEQKAKELGVFEKIFFIWFVEWNDKNSFFQNAQVVAIPSESESYWLVGLEARFFQKNIITTFAGWLKDVLWDYKKAFTLEEWEKSFEEIIFDDAKISDFYYDEICKKYLLLK